MRRDHGRRIALVVSVALVLAARQTRLAADQRNIRSRTLSMKRTLARFSVLVPLLLPISASAWNKTGHFVVASIAYDNLTASTKMRVDALLAQHPDFAKWTMGVPVAHKGKVAFVKASAWPDDIKSDPRFFDANDPPTPEIPGLPPGSNKRNREWHFINVPFTMDETALMPPAATNALTKLKEFESLGTLPAQKQVFVLPFGSFILQAMCINLCIPLGYSGKTFQMVTAVATTS
jgi:hypothetical protein